MKGLWKWLTGKPLATVRRRVAERFLLVALTALGLASDPAREVVDALLDPLLKLFGW